MAIIEYTGTHSDGTKFGGVFHSDSAIAFEGNDSDDDSYVLPETLYLTDTETWIVNRVVVGNPDRSTYHCIEADEAREWLERNNHPEAVKRYFRRQGGRPNIGERLITTVPARMLDQIAELAEECNEEVPDTVRRLLREALAHRDVITESGTGVVTVREGDAEDVQRKAQHAAMEQAIRSFDGPWDPQRTVIALRGAGFAVDKKRARRILRDLTRAGRLTKVQDRPVQYRVAGE